MSMAEQLDKQYLEGEVHFKDIVDFLLESWKLIAVFGVIGVFCSVIFLGITPNQYEAKAYVRMAELVNYVESSGVGKNYRNVEDPGLLIARLQMPTTYSIKEIKACNLDQVKMPRETLVGMLKISSVKGVDSVVELKVRVRSKGSANDCLSAVFEVIRESQNQIIERFIEQKKILLKKYDLRLQGANQLILEGGKLAASVNTAYVVNQNKYEHWFDQVIRLEGLIAESELHKTKLISPIYASELPVYPSKKLTLTLGLLTGFFCGFLIMVIKKIIN
jgi:capsular polysaccharide biosynthesis protein